MSGSDTREPQEYHVVAYEVRQTEKIREVFRNMTVTGNSHNDDALKS